VRVFGQDWELVLFEGTPSRNLEELVGAKVGTTPITIRATPKPTSGTPINLQDRANTARRLWLSE